MLKFGHYICNNWQLLSVIVLISFERVNLLILKVRTPSVMTEIIKKMNSTVYCLGYVNPQMQVELG